MVDSVKGSRQIEQCKDSGVTTVDSIKKVREDLSNGRFSIPRRAKSMRVRLLYAYSALVNVSVD